MSSFNSQKQQQDSLKRRCQENKYYVNKKPTTSNPKTLHLHRTLLFPSGSGLDHQELVSDTMVPSLTVVLEGRSICQRISLHKLEDYQSLAVALRQMFVDIIIIDQNSCCCSENVLTDLSNAIPGHVIAYEDMENDLLLVGDLNWKDFVRVAKRIRILPAKPKSRKQNEEPN